MVVVFFFSSSTVAGKPAFQKTTHENMWFLLGKCGFSVGLSIHLLCSILKCNNNNNNFMFPSGRAVITLMTS